jgi:sec-independent protein translocase protein TatB
MLNIVERSYHCRGGVMIGPKDLPEAMRRLGRPLARLRRLSGEFQGQFQEALREAYLEHVQKDSINSARLLAP